MVIFEIGLTYSDTGRQEEKGSSYESGNMLRRNEIHAILEVCQPSVNSDSSPSQLKAMYVRLFRLEIGISGSQLTIVVSSRRPPPPSPPPPPPPQSDTFFSHLYSGNCKSVILFKVAFPGTSFDTQCNYKKGGVKEA